MKESKSYQSIFKATFLFGSVQVFTIFINIVKNKIIAFLLGTSGIGLIGLFISSYSMIQSACGLGIDQSSVRDLSESRGENNHEKVSKSISVIKKLLWFTSLLGLLVTMLLSKRLSIWTFGNDSYAFEFILLSLVVFLNIFNLGQLAILQGMRMLKQLAQTSVIGSSLGLLLSIPLLFIYGEGAIVPSLIITGLASVIISRIFLNKISYIKVKISIRETIKGSSGMIKLGVSLMFMSFIISGVSLLLRIYINKVGSVDQVGIYQAGFTIIHGYFGMVFTAMTKDYFPKLSSINKNNQLLATAANQQAEVNLLLIGPLVIVLLYLSPYIVEILYNKSFLQSQNYVNLAVFGIIFQAGSQTMGLILIAKNRSDIFIYSVLGFQAVFFLNNILMYKYFGITGLGLSFAINMIIHLLVIQIILKLIYNITYGQRFFKILIITLVMSITTYLSKSLENIVLQIVIGTSLLVVSTMYSFKQFKNIMDIRSVKELFNKYVKVKE